jgi:Rrf2 family protein
MFSKACEYAIRAMVCIAACGQRDKVRMSAKLVAELTSSPEAFTAKVLQKLSNAGLIHSLKGPRGGFELPEDLATTVTLSMVVSVIDGDSIYTGCALGLAECSSAHPCPLHDHFLKVREDLRSMLESTSIQDLIPTAVDGPTYRKG